MTSIKPAIAALITVGLLAAPFAAEAKKARPSRHHHSTSVVAPTYGAAALPVTQPRTSYGSSGQTVGTVTAPSIGSYNWPSVGVTNSVPTWSNTTR
ncbi:hypothetical protein ABIF65_009738 [Bradyrhizobium japonicum]|uniref:hypothetical protein n=1 Tax=Bradyrhizobium TaxID=374 RepID=UPI0004BCA543|nr:MULTISPECIES: hypothetical protein [Bradyrhizobium]MBR0877337.1 hypothetical protein [Bradyrhizobium liaoningense]MBR0941134.1 hypothetical protein [Bradyrhizobium liaoningense]MBR0996270.1 hypothetical protein [Bradyrhizobium liaoningense]MBR1027642.1 hypothetical protein [Bradyrhizobium liaoningense]MBR1063839.1 hypothetical protein [Bradyrhizobium liaoningense]